MQKRIVMIMTDSQRWDMVGCYGNPSMHTPCLDHLASEGLRFDRAYTTQPVCGPARSALFTGLYPHSNGMTANSVALGDNVKTVGQRLRDHGFHTAYIGKWHLDGGDYFGLGRCPDGWDAEYWYDMRCYLSEMNAQERLYSRQAKEAVADAFCYGHKVTDRAVRFIERASKEDRDSFLVVSYDEPHDPSLCPEPYYSMFRDYRFPKSPNVLEKLQGKPDYQKAWAGKRLELDPETTQITAPEFFGCNAYIDSQIGRVIEAVDRYMPDALVIYTSDHGDFLLSHSLYAKGPAAYDEITRIPLIVRWPGHIRPGVHTHPVSHIQITPTLLEAAGLPKAHWSEGESLFPAFSRPDIKTTDAVFMEFGRYEVDHDGFGGFQPMRAVFDGRYKLSVNLLSTDELYDLETDPAELNNLIDSKAHASIRDALHDRLLDWMNRTRDPLRGYYWERRPWRADARPATWDYTLMTRQREHEEYEPRQLDYATGLEMEQATRRK